MGGNQNQQKNCKNGNHQTFFQGIPLPGSYHDNNSHVLRKITTRIVEISAYVQNKALIHPVMNEKAAAGVAYLW